VVVAVGAWYGYFRVKLFFFGKETSRALKRHDSKKSPPLGHAERHNFECSACIMIDFVETNDIYW
jgi:hypothetical protein